ncbi:protein of unknown function [Thauera humireducens]|nr:protein of unknown function [Thauera humireducens]
MHCAKLVIIMESCGKHVLVRDSRKFRPAFLSAAVGGGRGRRRLSLSICAPKHAINLFATGSPSRLRSKGNHEDS